MIDVVGWAIVSAGAFTLAFVLIPFLLDRYFGEHYFGGRIERKQIDFITRQTEWGQTVLRTLVIVSIVSAAYLWPVLILGLAWLNVTWLLVFWGFMLLQCVLSYHFRDEKQEIEATK